MILRIHLCLAIISLLKLSFVFAKQKECKLPEVMELVSGGGVKMTVKSPAVEIMYEMDDAVYHEKYKNDDTKLEVLNIYNASTYFSGLLSRTDTSVIDSLQERLIPTKIRISAVMPVSDDIKPPEKCVAHLRVAAFMTEMEDEFNDVLQQIISCLENTVCDNFQYVSKEVRSSYPDYISITGLMSRQNLYLEFVLNVITDIFMIEFKSIIQERKQEKIRLPNDKVKINCNNHQFHTIKGKMSDMSTLKRRIDTYVSRKGKKFFVSLGMVFNKMRLEYEKFKIYKQKCTKFTGAMVTDVIKAELEMMLIIDFSTNLCKISMHDIDISHMKNFDLTITGQNIPNNIKTDVKTWFYYLWIGKLKRSAETLIQELFNEKLLPINCERYRQVVKPYI